jgi:hypothetical protein
MKIEGINAIPPLKPKTRLGRMIERTDFFGYNIVRDSVIPFFAFEKAHEEDVSVENLELAFANVLKKAFARPDGTISWTIELVGRIPRAFDYLRREYDVVNFPPSVIHTLNLMRRIRALHLEEIEFRSRIGIRIKEDGSVVFLESEYGILINEIESWVKRAE